MNDEPRCCLRRSGTQCPGSQELRRARRDASFLLASAEKELDSRFHGNDEPGCRLRRSGTQCPRSQALRKTRRKAGFLCSWRVKSGYSALWTGVIFHRCRTASPFETSTFRSWHCLDRPSLSRSKHSAQDTFRVSNRERQLWREFVPRCLGTNGPDSKLSRRGCEMWPPLHQRVHRWGRGLG